MPEITVFRMSDDEICKFLASAPPTKRYATCECVLIYGGQRQPVREPSHDRQVMNTRFRLGDRSAQSRKPRTFRD